jgi:hypothetical protein
MSDPFPTIMGCRTHDLRPPPANGFSLHEKIASPRESMSLDGFPNTTGV